MYCAQCGQALINRTRFCPECGTPVPPAAGRPASLPAADAPATPTSSSGSSPPSGRPTWRLRGTGGGQPPSETTTPPHYYAPGRPTNGLAIASMVLGILWLSGLGAVLALIFGYISLRQIQERGESGRGMAIAGIVLGWVGVAGLAIIVIFLITNSSPSYG